MHIRLVVWVDAGNLFAEKSYLSAAIVQVGTCLLQKRVTSVPSAVLAMMKFTLVILLPACTGRVTSPMTVKPLGPIPCISILMLISPSRPLVQVTTVS